MYQRKNTKVMKVTRKEEAMNIIIYGQKVKPVLKLKFLGTWVTVSQRMEEVQLKERIGYE